MSISIISDGAHRLKYAMDPEKFMNPKTMFKLVKHTKAFCVQYILIPTKVFEDDESDPVGLYPEKLIFEGEKKDETLGYFVGGDTSSFWELNIRVTKSGIFLFLYYDGSLFSVYELEQYPECEGL